MTDTNNTDGAALLPVTVMQDLETLDWLNGQYLPGGPMDVKRAIRTAKSAILNANRISHSLPGDVGMREALQLARDRLADMLMGDDGQAWKEAEKALPIIDAALTPSALSSDAGEGE